MPKPDEASRRAKRKAPSLRRLEQMKKAGVSPALPPNPAPAIVSRLMEIGLTEAAGMGNGPISWREIDAWCNRTGVDLPPWEARLLRRLSSAYVVESRTAESENAPAPWRAEVTQREVDTEEARLRMLLG